MPTLRSILLRLVPVLLAALMVPCSVLPGPAAASSENTTPGIAGDRALTREDLESFMDGLMAAHFQTYRIPGAAVAVVKDGEILLARGYGYADLEAQVPVDATRTLFRIGSVSKLFTWMAAMQLVEQGRLDLNRDVNVYLAGSGVQVPATFSEPVTMAHLMNHTAGFEDRNVGIFSHDPADVRPLSEVLAGRLPQRVRPPGELPAYSNHGAALAGYVVERISGVPWEAYIEEQILRPLGMERTTVRQPVPEHLRDDLATGYVYAAREVRFIPQGFEYVPMAPAGGASATAADMARFMIALLQSGRLGDATILAPETARQMLSTSYLQDPRLGGIAHGYLEQPYGSLRTLGHGGDTLLFHAEMRLIPSEGVGLSVAYNAPDGAAARDHLVRAFLDRYFGRFRSVPGMPSEPLVEAAGAPASTDGAPQAVGRYAGLYRTTRVPRTTMDRMIELLTVFTARPDPVNGSELLVSLSPGSNAIRFRQVEPGLFQEVDGAVRIAFAAGEGGRPDRLLLGSAWVGERLPWYGTPLVHLSLAVACLAVFLSAVIGWPLGWLRERRRRHRPAPAAEASAASGPSRPGGPRLARWIAGGISATFLAVLITLLVVLQDPYSLAFGPPWGLKAILVLALVGAVLSPATLLAAAVAWRGRYFSPAGRVHLTLVALAAVTFALWLNHWNLVGFRF